MNLIIYPTGDRDDASLARLDGFIERSVAGHAALILLDAVARSSDAPRIEHVKTPAGREALLLRL